MEVLLSLAVLAILIGLALHLLVPTDTYPRLQQLGIPTYFAGLLVFLLQAGPQIVSLID